MEEYIVRKAKLEDANQLKECMHLAYSKYIERLEGKKIPPFLADYEDEILHYPVWVVENKDKIVGGLILSFEDDYASIANISIHPNVQGNGIGKKLMKLAEKEAIKRGYNKINLATHILLTENVSYYEKLGWKQTEKDKNKVYMEKSLNKEAF